MTRLVGGHQKYQTNEEKCLDSESRLLGLKEFGKNLMNADIACTSDFKLFSIETWGSAWTDGLVFTVMAENDVWAEEIVRQWLESNGRENHRIDKVQALVSKNVRGVINVGAKLLDV